MRIYFYSLHKALLLPLPLREGACGEAFCWHIGVNIPHSALNFHSFLSLLLVLERLQYACLHLLVYSTTL